MPANRSRTTGWRQTLKSVYERGGAIEFTVADPDRADEVDDPEAHASGTDLVWRVRLLDLTPSEIVVEAPVALGREITIEPGIELVAAMTIGQNRWVFRTRNLGAVDTRREHSRVAHGLRLEMPTRVERCQRRLPRYDTRGMALPEVEMWPLLEPKSVLPVERAVELAWRAWRSGESVESHEIEQEAVMPTVGPRFTATLMNLGGGGIGLRIEPESAQMLARHRIFWIRLSLGQDVPVPVYATGKVVHTHIDSMQRTYAGIAFDFSFNHAHQRLIAEQILTCIESLQVRQIRARDKAKAG